MDDMDDTGFLGSFLSKGLKTNQLEVNTDEKTLRPIARLKEPRDLFALPKDKDNDCSQQAPRWPIECQVIEERIIHIPNMPSEPEPFYDHVGNELKPNPVGEENGIVVFNYNPISAVNYDKSNSALKCDDDSSDSDVSSCESQGSSPDIRLSKNVAKKDTLFSKILTTLEQRSSSNSNEEDDDDESGNDNDNVDEVGVNVGYARLRGGGKSEAKDESTTVSKEEIDDIWADKSPEYRAATPTYIRQKFAKKIYSYTVGDEKDDSDTSPLKFSPIGVNDRLIAGLEVDLSSTPTPKNDEKPNEDSSKDNKIIESPSEAYAKLKQNPVFNPDMSLNLEELAKLPLITHTRPSTATTTITKSYSWKATRSAKSPNRDVKSSLPSCSVSPTRLSTNTSLSITNSFSLPHSQQNNNNRNNDAPCRTYSEYEYNYNPNSNIKLNLNMNINMNQNHDYPTSSEEFTKICYLPQFSRSAVGGSKFLTNCHPYNPEEYDGLEFESRFESGNLAKAIQITPTYYELYLRPDLYTSRSRQWYYFRIKRTKRNMLYRFSIVNLIKSDSLYNDGMRPLMYSTLNAKQKNQGWVRCGDNICYYRNDEDNQPSEDEEDNSSYTLTFNIEFENDNDTVYFAHSYPYTYSDLQDYLMEIQKHPVKSKFCKLRLLCRTLAGNNVYFLTVTAPAASEELLKRKKSIVISARVHPSETPASWMMKGLMDFITGESTVAKRLRHKFIFKLIPMLNPDGVIVGNTRNSLTGKDLNRQYRTVIRETYPSIWYTKALIKRLIDECGVSMYCDMHAHSRRHNIFIYGCENKRNADKKLTEQVFPLMLHKNVADKFSFEDCKFKIQRSKEGTGRIVVWMLGITNSYTLEASFGGSLLGSRKGTHFTTQDYEHMGRAFCETLLDYADENPSKECLRLKIIERLMKEGSSADEPINIALSDYSSDEGSSSSSENEGKSSSIKGFSDLEGPCCHPLRAPPCSPEIDAEVRKFRYSRMRKIMQELDRIYFQPLFHKKCQFLFKSERNTIRSRKRKSQKKSEDVTKAKSIKTNSTPYIEANLIQNHNPNSGVLFNNNTSQDISKPPISLSYVLHESESEASIVSVTQENPQECKNVLKRRRGEGGQNPADQKPHKPRLKLSRKLRVWLEKRQILITRRKLSNKMKFRYKSLHKRKKDERFLLDLPTTDPGSELVFSTDDEFVIDGKNNQCYGTMARYIRRGLLQSELQRHYIEEIGDGFRHMPPELIVTSPANKIKRPPIQMQIKPTVKKAITPKSAELPVIDESVKRTSSWQNLGTPSPSASLTSQYPSGNTTKMNSPTPSAINIPNTHTTLALTINMPRTHSPMPKSIFKTKTIAKKEPLSKEDLDIKLSLKKKIWTGIQPDDSPYAVDRTRSLLLAPPASLQTPPTSLKANKTVADGKKGNAKRLENEALLSACTQKLIEWQGTQPNESDQNNSSPAIPQTKLTADFVIPEINQERTMRILKHLVHIKKPGKLRTNHEGKSKQKKSAVTKLTETSTMITKVAKSKAQKTSHRPSNKSHNTNNAVGSLHKLHGRSVNKFKTGGIVATAVQTSTTVKQKSKKHKTTAQKLQDSLGPLKINGTTGGGGGDSRLSTACAIAVRDAPTTIARKVKTKLKKKKSPAKLQNMSSNLNSNTPATV